VPPSDSEHLVRLRLRALTSATRAAAGYAIRRKCHQILAMRTHLPASHYGRMDPASARYLIRVNGHLGATLLSAFPAMTSQRQGPETVLTGVLDQPGLHGVLAEIEALGLDLLEVRKESKE
jgi:hypothetical protein